MTGNKKKKRKDTISLLAGLMVAAIALAVAFYGIVAYATIRPGEGKTPEPQYESDSASESSIPEDTEVQTPEKTDAPTDPPLHTVTPDQVTVETKPVEELRLIQQPDSDTIYQVGEETSQDELRYPTDLPAELDTDGRSAAANAAVQAFAENGTAVTVYCAGAEEKKVSFIFYAGQEEGCTESVIQILKTYGIRSTFFVSHYYAAHSADRVKQMIAEGHELGNYSYSCPADGIISGRSLTDIVSDAINEHNYIRAAFNTELQKYSFPAGAYSLAAGRVLAEAGYEVCFPSVLLDDIGDEKTFDRGALFASLKASLHPGAVYAFHLENGIAAEVLIDLISYATQQGYTITQLN